MSEEQKKEAYEKAQMIYDSLQMGTDFAYMARTYSEDPGSARSGGEIPWFGTGRMIPEFEDACFSIERKGEFTKPFKSFYGWHIIKLIDKKGIGTYEEMEAELQEKINRGDRGKHRTEKYVSKLKEENGFVEYPGALDPLYASLDTTLLAGTWKGGTLKENNTPLMKIGDRRVTLGEFVAYIEANQNKGKSRDIRGYVETMLDQYTQEVVMGYEESKLPEKYPEFRYIYQEYHDGILLFDIMDQRVWSKAVSDTLGLMAFHKEHKKDYMWQNRTDAYVVTCDENVDQARIRKAYKKILKGKLDEASLNAAFCSNDTLPCISLSRVLVEKGENEMVDALNGKPGLGPVIEQDSTFTFVILKEVRSPEPKQLDEARGQITSDYQNYLERLWIEELKEKYPVEVDRSLLARIKS